MKLHEWIKSQGHGALKQLSRDTGLSYNTVHAIAHGTRVAERVYPSTLLAIERATRGEVTVYDLMGVRPPKTLTRRAA